MEHWFSAELLSWYKKNKRDLPWRHTKDPFHLWLSEIILQQTQVKQGLSYYRRFVERFQNPAELASAKSDEVMKLWQGLGYYSRARNLHQAAKDIVREHRGRFPRSYDEIRRLKGVGDYTAAAVASFAFDLPYAVVDGNVYRVLSRIFGIDLAINSSKGKTLFRELAQSLLPENKAALHNQAIMEFGALHCLPKQPDCASCIFAERCVARRKGLVKQLPVKTKKQTQKNRFFSFLVPLDKAGYTLIRKRQEKDIWQGLYQFPLLEHKVMPKSNEAWATFRTWYKKPLKASAPSAISELHKHQLSHQVLRARFYVVKAALPKLEGYKKVKWQNLHQLATPRLIHKFIEDWESREKNYI